MRMTETKLRNTIRRILLEVETSPEEEFTGSQWETESVTEIAIDEIESGPSNPSGWTSSRGDVQKAVKRELRKRGQKFKHGSVNKIVKDVCDNYGL